MPGCRRDCSNDHRRAVRHRQHEHARLGPGGGLRAGPRAHPGDLRRRGVHPRRRRAPRRRRLRRRRARRLLAVRTGVGAGSRRGRPHRLVRGGGQARHGQCGRRLRRRRRRRWASSTRSSGTPGVIGFCLGGTLAWAVAVERRPQRVRQLLRLGCSVDDRPDRQRLVPDVVPLRRCRRLHPQRRCRCRRRGARRPTWLRAQRRGRRPRVRQPRERDVLQRVGGQGSLVEDDGVPRRAPAR